MPELPTEAKQTQFLSPTSVIGLERIMIPGALCKYSPCRGTWDEPVKAEWRMTVKGLWGKNGLEPNTIITIDACARCTRIFCNNHDHDGIDIPEEVRRSDP